MQKLIESINRVGGGKYRFVLSITDDSFSVEMPPSNNHPEFDKVGASAVNAKLPQSIVYADMQSEDYEATLKTLIDAGWSL